MAVWEIKFVHPEWAGGEITTGLPGAQDFFMKSLLLFAMKPSRKLENGKKRSAPLPTRP